MGFIMGYLISSDKTELETLQNKIHNYMKANIKDYTATRWNTIIKHPTQKKYALLIKENDPRLPYNAIKKAKISLLVKNLPNGWIKKRNQP